MDQSQLSMSQQTVDANERQLSNLETFKRQTGQIKASELEIVHNAALDGGISPDAAAQRILKATGASKLLEVIDDWIAQQKERVEAAKARHAQAEARFRAERAVDAEDRAALIAAFSASADEKSEHQKQQERQARIKGRMEKGTV